MKPIASDSAPGRRDKRFSWCFPFRRPQTGYPLIGVIRSLIPGPSPPVGNCSAICPQARNLYAVGLRVGRKKHPAISRTDEVRTLALIVALTMLPAGGTVAVIALTSLPDLSELTPAASHTAGYSNLSWPSLLRDQPRVLDTGSAISSGAAVEILGYMMDGNRTLDKGEWVHEFTLFPEAGNRILPAHRFGDQMIRVHLLDDARLRFSPRALVWVRGNLRILSGDPNGDKPLYTLEQARAQLGDRGEIRKYFR